MADDDFIVALNIIESEDGKQISSEEIFAKIKKIDPDFCRKMVDKFPKWNHNSAPQQIGGMLGREVLKIGSRIRKHDGNPVRWSLIKQ